MALGEGTALGILTGETHEASFTGQGAEGEQLAEGPVDLALAGHLVATLDHGADPLVDVEALRGVHGEAVADFGDDVRGDGGVQAGGQGLTAGDAGLGGRGGPRDAFLDLVEDGLQLAVEVVGGALGVLGGDVATSHERVVVDGAHGRAVLDDAVQLRLGHRRVIGLVVTAAAVAHHVDEDVLAEASAVFDGQTGDPDDGLGVVTVDVEDRGVEALGDVGGVVGGAATVRGGGEADLVVDHDVDRATDGVTAQLGQVEGLLDDAQAREGGVTVHEDRHDRTLFGVRGQVLVGAGQTLHDRVDGLEVGRVRGQGDLDVVVAEHLGVDTFGAQVVLHVTGTTGGGGLDVALELTEDGGVRLADDVRQDVEATTVGHTDDDLFEALLGSLVRGGVQHRDEGLGALEGEALLADVLGLEEVLESLGGVQLLQQVLLLGVGQLLLTGLDVLLQPETLVLVEDVGVLGADLEGVGLAQGREDLTQGHGLATGEATDVELTVQVPEGQAVALHVEVGVVWHRQAGLGPVQRVDVGDEVAAGTVGLDELHDPGGLVHAGVRHILGPAGGGVGDAQGDEDLVPEAVVDELAAHVTQELAGLRTLDDAVVVGRGDGDELADTQVGETVLGGTGELRRVVHGTDTDDRTLAVGEAGHGVAGTDAAGVGQLDGDAGEVVHRQLALAGADDDVLVGVDEALEGEGLAVADGGDNEVAAAVLGDEVDGQSEVDVLGGDHGRLAVDDLVAVVHRRVSLDGVDQCPTEDVGEADLAATLGPKVVVDHRTVLEHELRRHVPDGGGRRDRQGGVHVLGDRTLGTLEVRLARGERLGGTLRCRGSDAGRDRVGRRCDVAADGRCGTDRTPRGGGGRDAGRSGRRGRHRGGGGGGRRGGGGGGRRGRHGRVFRSGCRGRVTGGLPLGEEVPPFLVHGLRVLLELLVHLVDQPFVGTEIGAVHSRSSPHFMMLSISTNHPTTCVLYHDVGGVVRRTGDKQYIFSCFSTRGHSRSVRCRLAWVTVPTAYPGDVPGARPVRSGP